VTKRITSLLKANMLQWTLILPKAKLLKRNREWLNLYRTVAARLSSNRT
jgi:hypothetical protein